VEALAAIVGALPKGFPAAIAVVLHVAPSGTSVLPAILDRAGALPARAAHDGAELTGGHIFVAPPDQHVLVADGRLTLRHGPRENGHRPAIDPLFATAADAYGPNAIGVILTGTLDDGAAGLAAIKSHGGVAVVQDPDDALYPGMPRHALERVDADHVVALADVGRLLVELVGAPSEDAPVSENDPVNGDPDPAAGTEPAPAPIELTVNPAMRAGGAAGISCPECGGALWYVDERGASRFRCRIGHAYSEESLAEIQGRSLEVALWTALRALEERAALIRRMAGRARHSGHPMTADQFGRHAAELDAQANTIREHIVPAALDADVEAVGGQ
jgi:two-component system chemotaxis response regulator CheB